MYRKTFATINLENLRENVRNVMDSLPTGVKTAAVVKADAYGHGAVQCARAAAEAGSEKLCIALAEEAIELRENGIALPIVVIGKSNHDQLALCAELGLEPCVFTKDDISYLDSVCAEIGATCGVHIKIDTGMGRIGLRTKEEARDCLKALSSSQYLRLAGIFSHFANSDASDTSDAQMQYARFCLFRHYFDGSGQAPDIHICNSAGILALPEYAHDMVRLGISMYGYYPSDNVIRSVALKPVMEVTGEISYIKEIQKGESVSYGSTYTADRTRRIATVQIGYGDGYNRCLSNCGKMIVCTEKGVFYAPVVGRVCMDQTMIDVTETEGTLKPGDAAIVLGSRGDKKFDADDMAKRCSTISYEILLDFNSRVPRIYVG